MKPSWHGKEKLNRFILLVGDIDEKNIYSVEKNILGFWQKNRRSHIFLSVCSMGGNLYCANHFYSFIRINRIPLVTIAHGGYVNSSALVVFLAGMQDYRFSTPDALFFMHPTYRVSDSRVESKEDQDAENNLTEIVDKISREIIQKETGLNPAKIISLERNRTILTAEDAQKYKIVSQIIPYPQKQEIEQGAKTYPKLRVVKR